MIRNRDKKEHQGVILVATVVTGLSLLLHVLNLSLLPGLILLPRTFSHASPGFKENPCRRISPIHTVFMGDILQNNFSCRSTLHLKWKCRSNIFHLDYIFEQQKDEVIHYAFFLLLLLSYFDHIILWLMHPKKIFFWMHTKYIQGSDSFLLFVSIIQKIS